MNTSGSAQNLSLASGVWDTVIVQDQSQIPGFYRTDSDWLASKNGSVHLADRIDSEGAAMMLMMTWGRRNGDAQNSMLYSNFTVMQDRLEQGYIDYRDNISLETSQRFTSPLLASPSSTSMIPSLPRVAIHCPQHRRSMVSILPMEAILRHPAHISQHVFCLQHSQAILPLV